MLDKLKPVFALGSLITPESEADGLKKYRLFTIFGQPVYAISDPFGANKFGGSTDPNAPESARARRAYAALAKRR